MAMLFHNQKYSSVFRSLLAGFRSKIVEPFLLSDHPPWYDARGSALGLLVGFGFPLGSQWIFLAVTRVVFKFNIILALALTWVNNPLTVAPMYYGYYLIGTAIIGNSTKINSEAFLELMEPLFQADSFFDSLSGLAEIGSDILLRWGIGASVVGLLFGVLGYVATYYIQSYRLEKRLPKSRHNR